MQCQNNCDSSGTMARQLSAFPPIVVTNCTTRKRAVEPPVSIGTAIGRESLPKLAKRWAAVLRRAPRSSTAGELYVGRAMAEAKSVAHSLAAELFVVSAGLGLVHEQALVPNYDFTASSDTGPLRSALEVSGEPITNWWAMLTQQSGADVSLRGLVSTTSSQLVFLALPASYLRLVVADLATVDDAASRRLRIFTSEAGKAETPANLKHCVLPYDERLESLEGYDGTRAEFPQRALRHFVDVLQGHRLSLEEAHANVLAALDGLNFRKIPARQKRTDAQIAHMIRQRWTACAGSSTRLHRYLRDEALVACEQSRFRTLWQQVRAERQAHEVGINAT